MTRRGGCRDGVRLPRLTQRTGETMFGAGEADSLATFTRRWAPSGYAEGEAAALGVGAGGVARCWRAGGDDVRWECRCCVALLAKLRRREWTTGGYRQRRRTVDRCR